MSTVVLVCFCAFSGTGDEPSFLTLPDIHIRDPFILALPEEKSYLLFGTHTPKARDFVAYSSSDLLKWQGPSSVLETPAGFWATRDFWAPEVHRYAGRYFMFASLKAEKVRRGTQVFVSDAPQGPYRPHSDGPVTPREWDCLDGTLFVDEDRQPWIVFCHEWTQVRDGEICAMRMSQDLSKSEGGPILFFRASEAAWVCEVGSGDRKGLVTDGPFLHRLKNGKLIMLWSSFSGKLYAQAIARSASGKIDGPWKQDDKPLLSDDCGHGMLFRTIEGGLMLSLHGPNRGHEERARLFSVDEQGDNIACVPWPR